MKLRKRTGITILHVQNNELVRLEIDICSVG